MFQTGHRKCFTPALPVPQMQQAVFSEMQMYREVTNVEKYLMKIERNHAFGLFMKCLKYPYFE